LKNKAFPRAVFPHCLLVVGDFLSLCFLSASFCHLFDCNLNSATWGKPGAQGRVKTRGEWFLLWSRQMETTKFHHSCGGSPQRLPSFPGQTKHVHGKQRCLPGGWQEASGSLQSFAGFQSLLTMAGQAP